VVDYIHCLCHSVLLVGGFSLPTNCAGLCSFGRRVVHGAHLLGLQIYTSSFGTRPVGRNGGWIFPRQMLSGTGSRPSQGSVLFDPRSSSF
jgi:hypothetical protein